MVHVSFHIFGELDPGEVRSNTARAWHNQSIGTLLFVGVALITAPINPRLERTTALATGSAAGDMASYETFLGLARFLGLGRSGDDELEGFCLGSNGGFHAAISFAGALSGGVCLVLQD